MSEAVLIALVHFFAFISNFSKRKSERGREVVEQYLRRHINPKLASDFLSLYDEYIDFYSIQQEQGLFTDLKSEISRIVSIGDRIKKDLDEKERLLVYIRLLEYSKEIKISGDELNAFLEGISTSFLIQDSQSRELKSFIQEKDTGRIDWKKILILSGEEDSHIPDSFKPGIYFKKARSIINDSISGSLFMFELKEINSFLFKYYGSSKLYIHGQRIQVGGVYFFDEGSIIKGPRTTPIYFNEIKNVFGSYSQKKRISLVGKDIQFRFRNSTSGIQAFSFRAESGEMIGIMGGSGVGKSTLLNVLNGKLEPLSGSLLINGYKVYRSDRSLEGVIGYVPQDDLLIDELSVYQNLYFNARLCHSDYSELQLKRAVLGILRELDLSPIKNLKVGNPLNKTISGGQRKRLNIALELIREPSILYVDEPTSGLSSADSDTVMLLLKELSLKGKLVIINIHQPSSDIYKLFDRLWILDKGGYPIYSGNPLDAIEYFKKASHFADTDDSECHTCGNINPEQVLNIIESKEINEFGKYTDKRKFEPEDWYAIYKKNLNNKPEEKDSIELEPSLPDNKLNTPGKFRQFRIYSLRNLVSKVTDRQYMLINLLEAPLLAFLIAFFSKYTSSEIYYFGENKNIPAFLFMSVVVALFMGLIVSSEEIFKDRKILERESFLNLSRFSYLNSKVVYLFILSGIQSLSFVLVANWILEIKDLTFSFWIILFTTSCLANIIGLIISSAFDSVATIYIIIPFILIPQLLLSGAIIHFDDLHKSLTNKTNVPIIGDMMTSRWAYEALTVETFKKNRFNSMVFEYNQRASEGDYYSAYYFPTLKAKIESYQPDQANFTDRDIKLIFNEIKNLENKFGDLFTGNISHQNNFILGDTLMKEVLNFIQVQEEYYQRSSRAAKRSRDSVFSAYRTEFGVKGLSDLKKQNSNTKLEEIMLNRYSAKKILELKDRLIRKLEPAYMKPDSNNGRAHFYAPVKKIGNVEMDTLWFNVIVIWLSSLLLYLVLYFDLLRKGIVYLSQFKR